MPTSAAGYLIRGRQGDSHALALSGTGALENSKTNRILAQLTASDLKVVQRHLEPVTLVLRQRIEMPNKPIEYAYFVDSGIISVVATGAQRQTIEVGVIGIEGCTGQPHILGANSSPLDTYVQVAGTARRIKIKDLETVTQQLPVLRNLLLRCAYAFSIQVAYTALANGHGSLTQRLARWLLMAQDRLQSSEIGLTHEFLAIMLGVRRPGVTVTLAELQTQGMVTLRRGAVIIIDRDSLLKLADRYYGVPEAESQRILTV
jgi:CRP-like cAMP-binding protein